MKLAVLFLLLVCTVTAWKPSHRHREDEDRRERQCQCMILYKYKPVCATNGKSFDSVGTLACYKMCNPTTPEVRLLHKGSCKNRSPPRLYTYEDDEDDDDEYDDSSSDSSSSEESNESSPPRDHNKKKYITVSIGKVKPFQAVEK